MILTCEECHARYLVPVHSLSPNGRTVKCGNCGHTWFEDVPESDDSGDDAADMAPDMGDNSHESFADILRDTGDVHVLDDDDGDAIPEGVRPIPEGSSVPAFIQGSDLRARLGGYACAMVVFLAIMGGLYALRDSVMLGWSPSRVVYEIAGVATLKPMDGLIFDQVVAKTEYNAEGVEILSVSGKIINLRSESSKLYPIRVSVRVGGDETLHDWVIDPPVASIDAEQTVEFNTTYPDVSVDAQEVNVQFTLAKK